MADVEGIKLDSNYLRGDLSTSLADGSQVFTEAGQVLIKFHGIYAQDNREVRRARTQAHEELDHIYMVRASVPGGVLTGDQWLRLDDVATEFADGKVRLTSRQGVQYHFVRKGGLAPLISALNERLVTTLAACGDVTRNVQCCPAPLADRRDERLQALAALLAARFRPTTSAYYDVWMDGDHVVTASPDSPPSERIPEHSPEQSFYGPTYLPRKFKMGIAWPGDNCIDVYANDLGLVPVVHPEHGDGFAVLVGGGLGAAHARPEDTYPRLAEPLGWIAVEHVAAVAEAVVVAFRDLGNREDRKRARLKYVIDTIGISAFRVAVVERLVSIDSSAVLRDSVAVPDWTDAHDHLGWHQQSDGTSVLGLHVESGKVLDEPGRTLRTALREAIVRFGLNVRVTAQQNLLLTDIADADRSALAELLSAHGIAEASQLTHLVRNAMACPALPTCGQALGEAERVLPKTLSLIAAAFAEHGISDPDVVVRMTGCPNGCARPYTSEIGLVGRTKTAYDIHVGGSAFGTRLTRRLAEGVKLNDLSMVLSPVIGKWVADQEPGESFGDFCARTAVGEPPRFELLGVGQ
jgi:sulfite reductase (ferredoxin)